MYHTVRPGDGHNIKVCSFGFKLKFDNFPIVWFFRAKVYHLNLASFFFHLRCFRYCTLNSWGTNYTIWGRVWMSYRKSIAWADAFSKSKCPSVCGSVCPFVCSLFTYRLNVFLPPLPKVGCPIFLEIPNPWGKLMERSGLRSKHFCLEVV